jgi:predicted transcriptional regulator
MRGEKRVEFRRRPPAADTSHVIVYATAPVRRIVGWFAVVSIEADRPRSLWRRFGGVGSISMDAFDAYYGASEIGAAIRVGEVESLAVPIRLEDLEPGLRAPQSFRYVDRSHLATLAKAP